MSRACPPEVVTLQTTSTYEQLPQEGTKALELEASHLYQRSSFIEVSKAPTIPLALWIEKYLRERKFSDRYHAKRKTCIG